MIEFYDILGLFSILLLFILISKVDNFFKKTEKTLDEIREQIDVLAKAQERIVSDEVNAEEQLSTEVVLSDILVASQTMKEPAVIEVLREPKQPEIIEESPFAIPDEVMEDCARGAVFETPREVSVEAPVRLKRKPINYEKFIGENLFGKIGILIFVIGVGLFVKYAIDQEWINETFRTILGFLTGLVLLATAGFLQKKYRTFSSLLAGGAFAVFYLTVAIAYHYYHLFSQSAAFVILIGITVFMSTLSVLYDRRELAITSLVGGFLAPFIVSSGEGGYLILFTYLSVLNAGMFGLSFYKKWRELPVISFVFTYIIMCVFVTTGYNVGHVPTFVPGYLFAFASLFYFIFLLPILSILRMDGKNMSNVLLSTIIANNFIYLFFGITFLNDMELPFRADGLLTLFIAIVNLSLVVSLRKRGGDYRRLIYTILGLVLTFVSITVPIQLKGNYITLFWAAEMVLLLWLYAKSKIKVYEYAAFVLVCLTLISFVLDIAYVSYDPSSVIFLNSTFATSLFMGLATGAFAMLLKRYQSFFSTVRLLNYTPWNAIMLLACTVILYCTFMTEFATYFQGVVRHGVLLLYSSISILVVCWAFGKRFPMKRYSFPYMLGMGVNVLIYMVNIWGSRWENLSFVSGLMLWLTAAAVIVNLCYVARRYYAVIGLKTRFTVYLNVLATLLWLTMVRLFLLQMGITDFNTGFSLALSVAGFVQMGLGMRLHQKVLRIISLSSFGIVLLKLILVDLWAMPTVGKIVVFVMLGLILLVLSFLYQKLKGVLFKNDEDETN